MLKLVAFDAYGTLLDFTSATDSRRDRLGVQADAVADLWRRKQLEYTWLRTLMGRYADFRQVTEEALDYALTAHGLSDPGLSEELMALYDRLSPYPDAVAAVRDVRGMGMKTAVLSNGTPAMLAAGLGSAGLADLLDGVLSVDAVGRYKPDPAAYSIACDRFGVTPQEVVFVSANGWDAAGAAAYGFRVAWLNRAGAPDERLPAGPAVVLPGLDGLRPWLAGIGHGLSPKR